MAVCLRKGQKVDLTKSDPRLNRILVGLGWDTNDFSSGYDYDLDSSVFMLGSNNRVNRDEDFVFYGNLRHPSGAVTHMGDNLTGAGDGDDEQVLVDLSRVPGYIDKITFVVTIYDADIRRQNFGQVSEAYIRLVNQDTGKEIIRYELGEDFSTETALVVGELYRYNGEWKFNAIGSGFDGGLEALCTYYGLDV